MENEKSLYQEVRELVASRVSAGVIVRVEWLTTEIIAGKDRVEGDDLPFYTVCAYKHVTDVVKRCIGKYEPKATPTEDPLPGFEHMQKAYPVERDGDRVLVPVDQLSDAEIEARADEYMTMAKGCIAHAKELRAFRQMRAPAA